MDVINMDNLDPRMKSEFRRRLQALVESAPSDASVRFLVKRSKAGYKGLIKICSLQRQFMAKAAGAILPDTVERLFDDLKSQIETWRKERFNR